MLGTNFRQQALGTFETILGAMHVPFAPSYKRHEKGVTLHLAKDRSNAQDPSGVRLRGFLNQHDNRQGKALVLILHGWQGSSHTPDTMHLGSTIFNAGFDTFRLNCRDHGESHPLNEGLFHGGLIDEVADAVEKIALINPNIPLVLVGSSLGGNFALRLGLEKHARRYPNLDRIISVCPAVNPRKSAQLIDTQILFRRFFCYLWQRSLLIKAELFPHIYSDFNRELKSQNSMESMTEYLLQKYFCFSSLQEYYDSYSITPKSMSGLVVPSHIIASSNDPVICIKDMDELAGTPKLTLDFRDYGGHIGFVNPFTWERNLASSVLSYLDHL